MRWRERWVEFRELQKKRRARVRLTFQKCRKCKGSALLPVNQERPLCGRCRTPEQPPTPR